MNELAIALTAAAFGLAGTVIGAIVSARGAKAGADRNAQTVIQQVQDQAVVEHSHWLRQQRLTAYEGFLETWDECLRLTQVPADASDTDQSSLEPLREAAGRMTGRARRIALLGPPEVAQAAEKLAEIMQEDVAASAKFIHAAEAGLTTMENSDSSSFADLQIATQSLQECTGQVNHLLTHAREHGEILDGDPILAEMLASAEQCRAASREALENLQSDADTLSALLVQASETVELLTHNQTAHEISREQFINAASEALGSPPSAPMGTRPHRS
ncbi:hypothetical protein PV682_35055 [Streptomyces niveiscabiei]|uniref:hypothetical protein n=1 Tax=Streptomyces niveiscabiei TaxID=164115 RepID=UPI0029AB343C|nr:hypothetical protein [Streptomyces niveiscabiei]MDX3386627.1 hypothetical protein [Streptomyces niveiscabiei]